MPWSHFCTAARSPQTLSFPKAASQVHARKSRRPIGDQSKALNGDRLEMLISHCLHPTKDFFLERNKLDLVFQVAIFQRSQQLRLGNSHWAIPAPRESPLQGVTPTPFKYVLEGGGGR